MMGTWGEDILADDDAREVVEQYRRMINQGKEHSDTRRALERSWGDSSTDSDDGAVFWFAVAQAQWEYGTLEDDVKRRVEEIVEQGTGLQRWREGPPDMLAKREKAVRAFLNNLSKPNPKPARRAVVKRYPPLYLPGDCLAVELTDGSFAAVVVVACDDSHHTEGFDVIALLESHSVQMPSIDSFKQCLLISPKEDGRLIPVVRRCFARSHKTAQGKLHQIGQLDRLQISAITKKSRFMGRWEEVITDLEHYYGLRS